MASKRTRDDIEIDQDVELRASESSDESVSPPPLRRRLESPPVTLVSSPISLTAVRNLPKEENVDTVTLSQLLGDPLITECWQFNFLFDVDFVMNHFDEDVRRQVAVKLVHGSWREADPNKLRIDSALQRWPNVMQIRAWLADPFGCHHSKMMVLFRNDDTAQIVIHTSNMIPQDWANFTQAVWQSPLLPLGKATSAREALDLLPQHSGTGLRFMVDLHKYLSAYGNNRLGGLINRLFLHDFSSIKAALVSSSPGRVHAGPPNDLHRTCFGWPGLRHVLSQVPNHQNPASSSRPVINVQVSSVATLGRHGKWLRQFLDAIDVIDGGSSSCPNRPPIHHVVFPTVDEIQHSLDGYHAGGSIHMRTQSRAQQEQVRLLEPMLCRWSGPRNGRQSSDQESAGRNRAAPHIKTYVRFCDTSCTQIDWALLTSANLSRQAWGGDVGDGQVKIASYEIGVLLWPDMFKDYDNPGDTIMVPTFRKNCTAPASNPQATSGPRTIVSFRMPYDLPVTSYTMQDIPWSPTGTYTEPDWLGNMW